MCTINSSQAHTYLPISLYRVHFISLAMYYRIKLVNIYKINRANLLQPMTGHKPFSNSKYTNTFSYFLQTSIKKCTVI